MLIQLFSSIVQKRRIFIKEPVVDLDALSVVILVGQVVLNLFEYFALINKVLIVRRIMLADLHSTVLVVSFIIRNIDR